jgi:uncharacterized membrane protein
MEYDGGGRGSLRHMAFIGRLHPLLIHFPIALALAAAFAEAAAAVTRDRRWRTVAFHNVRAAAMFGVAAAVAGWYLARDGAIESSSVLEWHRWVGLTAAGATLVAALASLRIDARPTAAAIYRIALFSAAALVAVAGHLGASLVWGANFLRPS